MNKKTIKVFLALTLSALIPLTSFFSPVNADTDDGTKYEFEKGTHNGAQIYTDYVGETEDGEKIDLSGATCSFIGQKGTSTSVDVQIEKEGLYELIVSYGQPYDKSKKVQYLNVNGANQGEVSFTYCLTWKELSAGIVKLKKGTNNIQFESYWGYTYFDYLIVKPADDTFTNLKVDKTLVNPNATKEAKSLMSYLADVYGKHILSGQQELCGSHNYEASEAEFTYIKEKTGELPAVRGFDFMNYRGNGLMWDDECAERVIEWYKQKNGIPTVCWHWFSPADIGKLGDGSFYTEKTTFSIKKALTPGTAENKALLNDIDFMAGKLKQVQDAGVPILFRPLHEAEGGWFWWGAEGPENCVKLYRLLYDKFTNEHKINNLIWVWTSYTFETSSKWYPGNDVVDIVGYDKYNAKDGKPNGSAISSTFFNLVKLTDGKKLVTMSENDTIPQVSNLIDEMAGWLYFCPWYGWWLTDKQNNPVEWVIEMYKSDYCITLDEIPDLKTYPTSDFVTTKPTNGSTPTPHTTTTPYATPSDVLYGDLNGDKNIDSTDLALMKRYILGIIKEFSISSEAGDLNGDGEIDSTDFAIIKRYLLGLINKFPNK